MVNIQEFAENLAAALTTSDERWQVDPDSAKYHSERRITSGEIGLKNQFGLSLEIGEQGRIVISPLTPVGVQLNGATWHYSYGKPSITVSDKRTPKEIALDIRRRLFPHAKGWWTDGYLQAERSIEARSKVEMFQQTLLQYDGTRCTGGGGPSTIDGPGWTIRTDSSSTRVDIEFKDFPHARVIQLLDLYYQHILNKQGDLSHGR